MRFVWVTLILLCGCASPKKDIPAQPSAPTKPDNATRFSDSLDTRGSKVAAAVTVARDNATKPEVVRAESSVALSALPTPSAGDLAIARERAGKADQKDYEQAVAAGNKLLAQISEAKSRMEADQREASRISKLKDERIAELSREVEQAKTDAAARIWNMTGALLVVVGGVASAFVGFRIGVPVLLAGAFAGSLPFFFDSPYFGAISAITLAVCCGLGVWWAYDRVRDSVNASDHAENKPDQSPHDNEPPQA